MRWGRLTVGAMLALGALVGSVAAASSPIFQPYQAFSAVPQAAAVAVGDVTGDGRADVVVTNGYTGTSSVDFRLWVFTQGTSGELTGPVSYPTAGSYVNRIESVAVGDITGDGRGDVVVGVSNVGVQLFPQTANGTLGPPTTYATPDGRQVRTGRLDGNATLDVAAIGWGTGTVAVLLNDGAGGLSAPIVYSAPHSGYDDLEVGDVTGDARHDIVVMSGQTYATPNVSVLAQLAGGGFAAAQSYSVGASILTHGIGVGDVTGDGRSDVVASYGGNRPSSNVAVFAQNSSGTLAVPVSYASYDIPQPVDVADLDHDGRADVLTVHGGWLAAGVYRSAVGGGLGAEELSPLPYASHYQPHGLALGDVNGDVAIDAVIADSNNGLVVLYGIVPPPTADLAVAVSASSSSVKPRKPFWFDVRVSNSGPGVSTASLTVQLGGNPTKLSLNSSRCMLSGATVTCTFPDLAAGGSAVARISGTAPSRGPITAAATVGGSATDPNDTNDEASASIAVR